MANPDLSPAEAQARAQLQLHPTSLAEVGASSDEQVEYAGLVTRAIAIVTDALLIDAAALVVTGAVLVLDSVLRISNRHDLAVVLGGVLFFVWVAAYFVTFWTTTGQTPGGRVMQIRVARLDGKRIGPRRALVRLAWMVLSLPLFWGYLPVLWTARRRAVFDLMAGTVVETARPSPRGEAGGLESTLGSGKRDRAADRRSLTGGGSEVHGAPGGGQPVAEVTQAGPVRR